MEEVLSVSESRNRLDPYVVAATPGNTRRIIIHNKTRAIQC